MNTKSQNQQPKKKLTLKRVTVSDLANVRGGLKMKGKDDSERHVPRDGGWRLKAANGQ